MLEGTRTGVRRRCKQRQSLEALASEAVGTSKTFAPAFDAPFKVIARPQLYRRQLHFENSSSGGIRKRKGGTITPFGFRSGDLVTATKGKSTVKGYIGGYSEPNKVVSIYDVNWKRLGQYRISKTNLLKRSNGLCVV